MQTLGRERLVGQPRRQRQDVALAFEDDAEDRGNLAMGKSALVRFSLRADAVQILNVLVEQMQR